MERAAFFLTLFALAGREDLTPSICRCSAHHDGEQNGRIKSISPMVSDLR